MSVHKWEFDQITGVSVPDASGSLDGTLINFDFYESSNPTIANGYRYNAAFSPVGGGSKYITIPNATGLDGSNDFTMHFFATQISTSLPRTLISRGGSITGWEFRIQSTTTFKWTQSGVADLTSNSNTHINHDLNLFTIRRTSGMTQLFLDGEIASTEVTGGPLPTGANNFDLLFHVAENVIDEVSDFDYQGITDEIVIITDVGQTDTQIRDYWRSLQVNEPKIVGPVSYSFAEPYNTGLTINTPTGYREDELLVAYLAITHTGGIQPVASVIIPSGWHQITISGATYNNNNDVNAYYKIAEASEPPSYTWSFSDNYQAAGLMLRTIGVRPLRGFGIDRPLFFNYSAGLQTLIPGEPQGTPTTIQKANGWLRDDLGLMFIGISNYYGNPGVIIDSISGITNATLYSEGFGNGYYLGVLKAISDNELNQTNFYYVANTGSSAQGTTSALTISLAPEHGSYFEYEILRHHGGLFNSLVGL